MKNKKNIIILLLTLFIGVVVILVVYNTLNSRTIKKEKQDKVTKAYSDLTEEVKEYNEIRTQYNEKISNFILDKYKEEHEEYLKLLNSYNEVITNIDKSINALSDNCNIIYKDSNTNKICSNYKQTYEKLINIYISDIKNYNNNITKYNEYKNDNIELYKAIYDEYIDYNNDNTYEGRDNNETD